MFQDEFIQIRQTDRAAPIQVKQRIGSAVIDGVTQEVDVVHINVSIAIEIAGRVVIRDRTCSRIREILGVAGRGGGGIERPATR